MGSRRTDGVRGVGAEWEVGGGWEEGGGRPFAILRKNASCRK